MITKLKPYDWWGQDTTIQNDDDANIPTDNTKPFVVSGSGIGIIDTSYPIYSSTDTYNLVNILFLQKGIMRRFVARFFVNDNCGVAEYIRLLELIKDANTIKAGKTCTNVWIQATPDTIYSIRLLHEAHGEELSFVIANAYLSTANFIKLKRTLCVQMSTGRVVHLSTEREQ